MKVGHTTEVVVSPELPRHTDESQKRVQPSRSADFEAPQVTISQTEKLNQSNATAADVRSELVERVKAAIDDSSFKIDPSIVATRMIHETASLLQVLTGETTSTPSADSPGEPVVQNSQEKFGAGPANERKPGPDR